MIDFKVKIDFWDYELRCIFSSEEALYKVIEEELGEECAEYVVYTNDLSNCEGSTMILPSGESLLWMPHVPDDARATGVLIHELFHITKHALSEIQQIPLDDSTEEVYARVMGTLTTSILEECGI